LKRIHTGKDILECVLLYEVHLGKYL